MKIADIVRICGLAAALILAPPLGAQVIRPGTALEIVTPERTIRGSARSTTPTSLILGDADSVSFANIISWRSRFTYARTGAKSGAVSGGLAFTLLGALVGSGFCEGSNCDDAALHGAGIGAAFGAVTGGAVGAIIGSLVPRWIEQPKGLSPLVRESPLTARPIKVYVSQGRVSDRNSVTQGGVQLERGEWRVGAEGGKTGQRTSNTLTYQSTSDQRLRSFAEVIHNTDWLGVAAERRVVGIAWLTASATKRWRHEIVFTDDLGSAEDPRYPQASRTSTSAIRSSLGGSIGVALRHRVFDDVYLRLDARQELGAWATRGWSIGVEL